MYFFDLNDYYNKPNFEQTSQTWYNYGVSSNQLGCGGGPGFFSDDDFTTARATRDAWIKAFYELYASIDITTTGVEEGAITAPLIDCCCTPDFAEAYLDTQFKIVDMAKAIVELQYTYKLCKYYYDYGKTLNWQEIPASEETFSNEGVDPSLAWGGTYEQFKDYLLNTWGGGDNCKTGTEVLTWPISNPYTRENSGITFTANYGTSFEIADLTEKVNNYDNAMKAVMCSAKNFVTIAQGEITDAFDEDGNFDGNLYRDYVVF
jgi:hypothetical protein